VHLPRHAVPFCRLVCQRWRGVVGESIATVAFTAKQLRTDVWEKNEEEVAALGRQLGRAYPQVCITPPPLGCVQTS